MGKKKGSWYNYAFRLQGTNRKELEAYSKKNGLSLNDSINIAVNMLLISERYLKKKNKK